MRNMRVCMSALFSCTMSGAFLLYKQVHRKPFLLLVFVPVMFYMKVVNNIQSPRQKGFSFFGLVCLFFFFWRGG